MQWLKEETQRLCNFIEMASAEELDRVLEESKFGSLAHIKKGEVFMDDKNIG